MPKPPKIPKENLELITAGEAAVKQHALLGYLISLAYVTATPKQPFPKTGWARGLGAIASYAMSREAPLMRVIQCDAGIHDMGYIEPESLLSKVEVRGRGGTVLMLAVHKIEAAADVPKDAPLLIITDGLCDVLTVKREHAYLLPEGKRLPFPTRAPVFHFGE